jgi:hypothetical protein
MAIKLDTSSPTSPKASSFDPLPGVSSLATGEQQVYNQIAQSASNVSNMLHKQEQSAQQILINKARYSAMGQMEADYNNTLDAIQNNKEDANELEANFYNKYQSIDLNGYLEGDNVNKITMMDLAQNSIGELSYRYGSLENKLKRVKNNITVTNGKIDFIKETKDGFNDFFANNPVIDSENEQKLRSLFEGLNPENPNVQPLMFGSTPAAQETGFNQPIGGTIKDNLELYMASSVFEDELDERLDFAKDLTSRFGATYGIDIGDFNVDTLRKNIRARQEDLAQAQIESVIQPLKNRFEAAVSAEGVFRFQDNLSEVIGSLNKLDPRLLKYATDDQKEFYNTAFELLSVNIPNEKLAEQGEYPMSPLQDIAMQAVVLGDANAVLETVADLGLSEDATSKLTEIISRISDTITDGINNNTPQDFKLLFPELRMHLDANDWSSANKFYQEKILHLPIETEEGSSSLGKEFALPPVMLDYSTLNTIKNVGDIRDSRVLIDAGLKFFEDNGNNSQINVGLQYLIDGEGGGLTQNQANFAKMIQGASLISEGQRNSWFSVVAERLVPIAGRIDVPKNQVATMKAELLNEANDDFKFKFFGETGLLKDEFPVVPLIYNQLALGDLSNTSHATFNDTILDNLLAETIAEGGDIRAAADRINTFNRDYLVPAYGMTSAVEHQGNLIGVSLAPSTFNTLVDPEMGLGRSNRFGHDLVKNVTGAFDQSKFNTRSMTDVTESVLAATLVNAYVNSDLDLQSFYDAIGEEGLNFTGEYEKSKVDAHAFATGAVKNTYVSSANLFGAPLEGAIKKSIVKVVYGNVHGVDVYIPMYYNAASNKYSEFTSLKGTPVMVPVAVVDNSIMRFNRDKNKVLFWQAQDFRGPYQSKVSMYINYMAPNLKKGSPRSPGSGPVQNF